MTPYGFQKEARAEFLEAARSYEAHRSGLGRRFFDAVKEGVERIRERPLRYREIDPGFRQCLVDRFPYGLIYRLKDSRIEILAVMHLHREPGYWKKRASIGQYRGNFAPLARRHPRGSNFISGFR